jgi:hypothetical protein
MTRNGEPCLWVYYHGPGGISDWLGAGASGSREGVLHPRDHWAIRAIEVEQPVAAHRLSLMVPARTFRGLETLPQVCGAFTSGAFAVSNALCPLVEPAWLDEGTVVEMHGEALRASGEGTTPAYREYVRDYLNMASPVLTDRRAAQKALLTRTRDEWGLDSILQLALLAPFPEMTEVAEALQARLTRTTALPESQWQVVAQLLAEVGRLHDHQGIERQQELADLHRRVTSTLEPVARARFSVDRFPVPPKSRISILFRGWLSQSQADVNIWDPAPGGGNPPSPFYRDILAPVFGQNGLVHQAGNPPRLGELIDQVVANARHYRGSLGLPSLGDGISALLDAELGTREWTAALATPAANTRDGVAELLLVAKLVFEIRNFLTHGTVPDQAVDPTRVQVEDTESGGRLLLDWPSLDRCLRLTVVAVHATWVR